MPDNDTPQKPEETVKSRVDTSVPRPDTIDKLNENEKRALELQGEVEHATGKKKEEIVERAEQEVKQKNER